jgi:hypothetical protein
MWRDRNEYTDLDGGTQQYVVGHRVSVNGQSPLTIRLEMAAWSMTIDE